ncbi:MAG: DMT family transporter [Pseudomonadota bacterium]
MTGARLGLLTALAMVAFAANSLLNRAALLDEGADPAAFAAVRLVAGAVALWALVAWRGGIWWPDIRGGVATAAMLALYAVGFSFAYVSIEAGAGALLLFGGVQLTILLAALLAGERPTPLRWAGLGLALAGLVLLCWPAGDVALPPAGIAAMLAAAVGWGIYTLIGRGAADPLRDTAGAFVLAMPLGLGVWALAGGGIDGSGILLAVISGAVTSGLGYAIWYAALPGMSRSAAGLVQLTVPVIAATAGALFLAEIITGRILGAAILVLGGVALGLWAGDQRTSGSSGS